MVVGAIFNPQSSYEAFKFGLVFLGVVPVAEVWDVVLANLSRGILAGIGVEVLPWSNRVERN